MIRGITFSEQTFYSKDFAHFQNVFLNKQNGVTKGCSVSNDGTKVTIGTGYFFVQGRLMNVEEPEVIGADKGFSEGYNRIVYEIDLSKENTITEFRQGYIKVLNSESLKQEELDGTGKVYQFPFCHFQWSGTAITSFIADAPTLELDNIFAQIAANYESLQADVKLWFGQQQGNFKEWVDSQMNDTTTYINEKRAEMDGLVETAEGIIADLQAQGFENKHTVAETTLLASGWNAAEKTYSFEGTYPFSQYNIRIERSKLATEEQREALSAADIVGDSASNVYTACGDVPTIDIPVIIGVVRK